jgi:hypothetical protein
MTTDLAPPSAREGQLPSAFTAILETLCESCVGAVAAGLVDEEGECVDLASLELIPAYSVKLCGAHWQIIMRQAARSAALTRIGGDVRQLWIQTQQFSYVVVLMHADYVLVLICRPESLPAVSARAIRQVMVELCMEAGWPVPAPEQPYWRRARVLVDERGRSQALRYARAGHARRGHGPPSETWDTSLRVLSPLDHLQSFERGFQVRTDLGEDIALVREPSGFWYAGSDLALTPLAPLEYPVE